MASTLKTGQSFHPQDNLGCADRSCDCYLNYIMASKSLLLLAGVKGIWAVHHADAQTDTGMQLDVQVSTTPTC